MLSNGELLPCHGIFRVQVLEDDHELILIAASLPAGYMVINFVKGGVVL